MPMKMITFTGQLLGVLDL